MHKIINLSNKTDKKKRLFVVGALNKKNLLPDPGDRTSLGSGADY